MTGWDFTISQSSGRDPPEWGLQASVGEGFGNFRFVFLKSKELVFGRILRAQLCGGDTVSSEISHFAYLL